MRDALASADATHRHRLAAAEGFLAAGRLEEAGALLDAAIRARPEDADTLNALAVLALARGDLARAAAILPPAATAYPHHPGLVANLGTLHRTEGRLAEARACFQRAIALAPEREAPRHALAIACLMANDLDGAGEAARELLARNPHSAEAFAVLAVVALGRDDRPAAMRFFREALSHNPDEPDALRGLSACCLKEGETAEALALAERAQLLSPLDIDIAEHLALCQAEAGRTGEAEATCRGILAFAPHHVGLRMLLARIQVADGRAEAALAELAPFARAHAQSPEVLVGLAGVARQAGRLAQAGPLLDHALRIAPDDLTARMLKDEIAFAEGRFPPEPTRNVPQGTRILVPHTMPAGEFVLLARFLPAIADASGTVRLSAPDHVLPLARHLPVTLDTAKPGVDEETVPLGALPLAFALDPAWLGDSKPYLAPDPFLAARWRTALEEHPRPWIGVAWDSGGVGLPMEAVRRALPSGGSVVSLMIGADRHDLRDWPETIDAGAHCPDLPAMIAAIANLDAVVGPDVAMLHLAGALGRPGIVAGPAHRPWPWASRDGRSLWYPTLRVTHQARPGAWDDVVLALRDEIARIVSDPVTGGPQ